MTSSPVLFAPPSPTKRVETQRPRGKFAFRWRPRQPEDPASPSIDSSIHRCCCSLFHAKIGAFVITTLVVHEILIGLLYMTNRPEWHEWSSNISIVACRILQLVLSTFAYVGLWQRRHYFLVPFVVSQLTIGTYADLSTWVLLVRDAESSSLPPSFLFKTPLLYLVVPLLIYAVFCVFFTYAMYKCYRYFKARAAPAEEEREMEQRFTQMESLM